MSTSIKKNYLYNFMFHMFSLVMPLITTPYVSRVLQPEGVGTYSYVHSIAMYFSLVAALGISSYGTREAARIRGNRRRLTILFCELGILRVLTTVFCLVIYFALVVISADNPVVYLGMSFIIVAVMFEFNWFFQAMENFKILAGRNFLVKIISVILIFTLVKDENDLIKYILIQSGSIFFANVALLPALKKYLTKISVSNIRPFRHLKETFIYFIPTIATSVYTVLDKTMLGFITRDMSKNGYYEEAHKIINILLTVVTSLNTVVGVRTSYLFARNKDEDIKKHIGNTFRFLFAISFPLSLGLIACADGFVPWFYGEGYEPVASLIMLFAPIVVVIGISNVIGTLYLTPSGQRSRSNKAIVSGAVCNVVLNLLLIPYFGAYGAVISSISAELVISVIYCYFLREYMSIRILAKTAVRYILLAAVMFVPSYLVGKLLEPTFITTIIQVGVGVVVYVVALLITRDPMIGLVKNKIK